MPIYEYECPACGGKFELRRSIADSDEEVNYRQYMALAGKFSRI